ncbi:hypothetical protein HOD29_07180 [archaeon]|jgi:hypothetical protein|nr:hypothetical protein [archaeon]
MKIDKIKLNKDKFEINLKFYYFLKYLVKTKLTNNQADSILKTYFLNKKKEHEDIVLSIIETINKLIKEDSPKYRMLIETLDEINSNIEVKLFIFSLKLYLIKDLLLNEAKVKNLLDVSKLENLDPLSLEYDKITAYSPYSTRISGALLSLIFFEKLENKETNFISKDAEKFIKNLSEFAIELKKQGVEPNQIFMLMFSESINQSIISDSGSNYEERILSVLEHIGIKKEDIKKIHDKDDSSTEFDFFFDINKRTYGIGAKRTLRERYKQFIKTAQMSKIDVMIEITLGLDLNEEKAKAIRNHNVYIFVSDEVFNSRKFLQKIEGVYSVKNLNLKTLKSLK